MSGLDLHPALAALLALAAGPAAFAECVDIDDPLQVIDIHLSMDPADWESVRLDEQGLTERPATFRACGGRALPVRVRRKTGDRVPDGDDRIKVSLKVDFDDTVPDAEWHGHRKLSLEAGRGLGRGVILREGFAWQVFRRAGIVCGAASWVRVHMNDLPLGVYTRSEQIDKSYLRRHLGEDEGFLYKLDHGDPGGKRRRLTREGEPDPWAADLCWLPFDEVCPVPPRSHATLGLHLDLNQILLLAAVNAFIANFDAPLFFDNNYFWYNSERPRLYFPWDLDASLLTGLEDRDPHPTGGQPWEWGTYFLEDPWLRAEHDLHLGRLVVDAFPPPVLERLLDEVAAAIGPSLDADPRSDVDISFANEVRKLRAFIRARALFLLNRLPEEAREPSPVVINEVMASNGGVLADEHGRYLDWVELYNRGDAPAFLLGLYLSDSPAHPRRWPLPDAVLPPGGRLLIWCEEGVESPLRAGFSLDGEGEAVGLYQGYDRAPPGNYRLLDFVRFGRQTRDVALGRVPDGAPGFFRLPCATPGAPNREECPGETARFLRGDADGDGARDISDPIAILRGLFLGGGIPCADAADPGDDGTVDLSDAVALLSHLFLGGNPPAEPRSGCGWDPTPDGLGCESAGRCR